ncbi:MAG: S-methyl-5-thioribose-1-phosphate isomerase [Thermoplasmata archaeon]|nr:S-methyl-5-thioribose-1-phosphate isomerase [Thermoplasmata archaeon]
MTETPRERTGDHLQVPEVVEDTARKIETMEIRGAGLIARSAADALVRMAEEHSGEEFEEILWRSVERLISTRPTAVSLRNALVETVLGTDRESDPGAKRDTVIRNGRAFIQRSLSAVERIAETCWSLIPSGGTVLTICNSTVVVETIKRAWKEGRVEGVYTCETRPRFQGRITARKLVEAEVPTTMIVDSAARKFMPEVDIVLVGADTVTARGNVFNKIGTSQIAASARDFSVPFYSCAETYKISPWTLHGGKVVVEERDPGEIWDDPPPGLRIANPVFDMTPHEMIRGICTEVGILRPPEIRPMAEEMAVRYGGLLEKMDVLGAKYY